MKAHSKDAVIAAGHGAANNNGVPTEYMDAFAATETNFVNAANTTGGDAERGGAYSPWQMTLRTAWSYDPAATVEKLGQLNYAAEIVARHIRALLQLYSDPQDIAAMYNSDRPLANAPHSTLTEYVPRFMRNWTKYHGVT